MKKLFGSLVVAVLLVVCCGAVFAAEAVSVDVKKNGDVQFLFTKDSFSKYILGEMQIPEEYLENYGLVTEHATGPEINIFYPRYYSSEDAETALTGMAKMKDSQKFMEALQVASVVVNNDHNQIVLDWIIKGFNKNDKKTLATGLDVKLMPEGSLMLSTGLMTYRVNGQVFTVDTHDDGIVEQLFFVNATKRWQEVHFRNFKGYATGSTLVSDFLDPAWIGDAYIKRPFNSGTKRAWGGNKVENRIRIYVLRDNPNPDAEIAEKTILEEYNFSMRKVSGKNDTDPQYWDIRVSDLRSAKTKSQKW